MIAQTPIDHEVPGIGGPTSNGWDQINFIAANLRDLDVRHRSHSWHRLPLFPAARVGENPSKKLMAVMAAAGGSRRFQSTARNWISQGKIRGGRYEGR
jgi:hypothetical protein